MPSRSGSTCRGSWPPRTGPARAAAPGDAARAARLVDAIDHLGDHLPRAQGVDPGSLRRRPVAPASIAPGSTIPSATTSGRALSPREAHARISGARVQHGGLVRRVRGRLAGQSRGHDHRRGDRHRAQRQPPRGRSVASRPSIARRSRRGRDVRARLDGAGRSTSSGCSSRSSTAGCVAIEPSPASDDPPVRLFILGEDRWRDEAAWPLARAVATDFHLRSGGSANSSRGDGRLDLVAPGARRARRLLRWPIPRTRCPPSAATCAAGRSSTNRARSTSAAWRSGRTCSSTPQRRWRRTSRSAGPWSAARLRLIRGARLRCHGEAAGRAAGRPGVQPGGGHPPRPVSGGHRLAGPAARRGGRRDRGRSHRDGEPVPGRPPDPARGRRFELAAGSTPTRRPVRRSDSASQPRVARHTVHHDATHPSRLILPVVPRT